VSDTDVKPKKRKKVKRSMEKAAAPAHRGRSAAARARRAGVVCGRCNQEHVRADGKPSCNGHKKRVRPHVPCPRPPMKGAAVCLAHGGGSPATRNLAAKRVAWEETEGEVAKLLRECDLPDQHPIDGLLEVVRHSGAMMRLLGSLCAALDLDPGEVHVSITDSGDVAKWGDDNGLYGFNHKGDQATHILVSMYGQWADRYARACKTALDANIDERLVRNAESTTNAVFVAVTRALDKAKLEPAQAQEFSIALADELRKLAGPLDTLPRKKALPA
jgi:hypothetical protein